jgi:hypothetical protein
MTDADSLRQIAHSRAPFSVWFGTILLFMLFAAIVLALIGPSPRRDRYEESRARKRLDNLKTLHEADAKALTEYAWVDKAKGTVRIPIDRAMQLTLAELSRKKPAAAYPIATVAPAAPAAQPTAAPSAAPKSGSSPAATPATPSRTSSNTAPTPAPKANEAEGPRSENRSQPAGAANPSNVSAGSQPGANSTTLASPAAPAGKPAVSPTGTPNQKAPGRPLPVAGLTPTPTP